MIKVSYFKGATSDFGQAVFPLFHSSSADEVFEKRAAPILLPEVSQYIAALKPEPNCQYALVNAMGSGEFYGSNINSDWFDEEGLIHAPDDWTGLSDVDKLKAKNWPYGFPTFYNAHVYAHHRNKNPARSYGDVELAAWNASMHRVELILKFVKERCDKFGGTSIWDRLKTPGQFPDVSMGSKVPWDLCSICTDWPLYKEALTTFIPGRHKHPGEAVLQFHKVLKAKDGVGIRGLSITRKDYCAHMRAKPNRIYPDGRKVFVHNPFPRFFDISVVFIGADKTAKVMLKVASDSRVWSFPGAKLAEHLGYAEEGTETEKTASLGEDVLKLAFLGKKATQKKKAEIKKDGPTPFDSKAIPLLTKQEPSLPPEVLDEMCRHPLPAALSSPASLGIILRPKEFQRIIIIQMGMRSLADDLERDGVVFPRVERPLPMHLSSKAVVPRLVTLLGSLFGGRSALSPAIETRVAAMRPGDETKKVGSPPSLPTPLLHKIGSAYAGYRKSLMDFWEHDSRSTLEKTASAMSTCSVQYLKDAYWNEVGRL